ncbi:MAG: rod shape-determining protein MreD [Prevotellaceae bacterium]|jgi:rod shape-determining protein MreD|nr:rod shape-determining protein MreD [Prevotellaceae bacterium]
MKENLQYALYFMLLIAVQVLVLNQICLFGFGCIFLYTLFILIYPLSKNNQIQFLFISFLLGFIIDLFSNSYGTHTFACTLIAYLRPHITKLYNGADNFEPLKKSYQKFGGLFIRYAVTMILIHHFTLFMMEAFSLKLLPIVLLKTLVSSILTMIFIFFIQSLFIKKNAR